MTRDQPAASLLERGVQVLQAFRPTGGTLTLSALVARTGFPKATVHRIAQELVGLGLLEHPGVGYRPALGLFELGELAPMKHDLRETALPYMQDLYEATHATVHLAVRDGVDAVYAEKIRGHRGVEVPSRVGGRLPLSSTAVGKALLAFADPEVIDEVLSHPLRRLTVHSITDRTVLADELGQVRADGFAHDRQEAALDVDCIAAPVFANGAVTAAMSLCLPADRSSAAGLGPALRAVTLALGRQLSHRGR